MFIRKAVLNNKKENTRNFSIVGDKRSSERKGFISAVLFIPYWVFIPIKKHFIKILVCSPLAKYVSSRLRKHDTELSSRFICWRNEKKRPKNRHAEHMFPPTNFDSLPQIFAAHVCKTICASFALFFNMLFHSNASENSFAQNHLKNTNKMEKMNVFNTWSIFGVCGISFANIESMLHVEAKKEKKSIAQCYPISEKLCWISFWIVHFFRFGVQCSNDAG